MSAVMGGLRRLLGALGLWLGTWMALVAIAGLTGMLVSFVVASAVVPFGALQPDHLMYGILDVLSEHRAAAAAIMMALLASGLVTALGWMLLSPLCIAKLAGPRTWTEVGGRALGRLPAVVVQTLWHGVLRAVLVVAVVLTSTPLPAPVTWGLLALAWLVCGVALDVTRVAVVEHEASPFGIRSAAGGFMYAIRRPALLIPCALMSLGQLAITGLGLWLSLAWLSGGTPWIPRLLALVSVGLGLWRVGTVVERQQDDPF